MKTNFEDHLRKENSDSLNAPMNRSNAPTNTQIEPLLSLQSVSKSFDTQAGRVDALCDVTLKIMPGEFLCLVGHSGCGKSTLLNLVAGLERPDTGSITINNQPISGPSPDRLVIFQEAALFPWLTVRQNIEFGLKIKGVVKEERVQRASEALELVGLSKFAKVYPHQLSGGMKQRTAIARGLVLDPKILLMDEPFSALDAQTREDLYQELQIIWEQTKKTIMFVTHNVREAACLGDRIILMSPHPGRIHKEYRVDERRPRAMEYRKVQDISRTIQWDLKHIVSIPTSGETK